LFFKEPKYNNSNEKSLSGLNKRLELAEEKINLKIGQRRLSTLKNNKEK
jgi:hypothetical protein